MTRILFIFFLLSQILFAQTTYTASVSTGSYGTCPSTNITSFCPSANTNYFGNTIRLGVYSWPSSNQIRLQLTKCDFSSFFTSGSVYIKEGSVCGALVYQGSISAGNISKRITISLNHTSGYKDYYLIYVNGNNGDRYYTKKVRVYAQITPPSLTVSDPNGGESYDTGDNMSIQWNSTGGVGAVSIELVRNNNTSSYRVIADPTNNDGSYNWNIPHDIPDGNYRIKIYETGSGNYADYSNSTFRIHNINNLTILDPNGGDSYNTGSSVPIRWNTSGDVGNVSIELVNDNNTSAFEVIADPTSNDGSYDWTIPHDIPSGSYRIKIYETGTGNYVDYSNSTFTINNITGISVLNPNENVTYNTGDNMSIYWGTLGNVGNVSIELVEGNNTTAYRVIADPTANDGSFYWQIPSDIPTGQYRIKMYETGTGNYADYSNSTFTINNINGLTIVNPNGGESFNSNETIDVNWQVTGVIGNVSLELVNGSETTAFHVIADPTDNDGNFSWTIPDTIPSGNYRIKIYETGTGHYADYSDATFSITQEIVSCPFDDCSSSTNCGILGAEAFDAVQYLCAEQIVQGIGDGTVLPDDYITYQDLAKITFKAVFGATANPDDYPAANFPNPYPDLQEEGTFDTYHKYARTLCYLEFQDGVSPFDRDFFLFQPGNPIQRKYVVKVLLEAYNIAPATSWSGSSFVDIEDAEEESRGYIAKAEELGIVVGDNGYFYPNQACTRAQAFIMLKRMMQNLTEPSQSDLMNTDNYYVPFNYSPYNSSFAKSMVEGNFPHYQKSTFNIPDIFFNLSFAHQYNSYVTQLTDKLFPIEPLGRGWSHNYNHYIIKKRHEVELADLYAIVYPDGSMNMYKDYDYGTANDDYVTKGVYDDFLFSDNLIYIVDKSRIVYTYEKLNIAEDIFYLTKIKDRNNNALIINYEDATDANFMRVTNVAAPSGAQLDFTYHSGTDLLHKVVDPINREIEFSFDTENRLEHFYDAKDNHTQYFYDAGTGYYTKNLLSKIRLPEGNEIDASYDEQRKLAQFWTNNDPPTTIDVQDFNESDVENYQTVQVTEPTTEGNSVTTTISYNKDALPTHMVNNLGSVTHNFPTGGLHPTLPDNSNLNGVVIHYEYDDNGNVIEVKKEHPDGDIVQSLFWNTDNTLQWYEDPLHHRTNFDYTPEGNLQKITDPLNNETLIYYNTIGQINRIVNPESVTTTYDYFTDGMLQKSTLENGAEDIVSTFGYDDINRVISINNNGVSTLFDYDLNDNLKIETDPLQHTTMYDYDTNDNLIKLTNKRGYDTLFTYDDTDRLTHITFENLIKKYDFSPEGYLDKYTKPSEEEIIYSYDTDGLLSSTSTIQNITYDDRKLLESITNEYGQISIDYDEINRITSVENHATNTAVGYTYDAASNVTEITYPATTIKAGYTYDAKNRIDHVYAKNYNGQAQYLLADYTYLADNRLQRVDYTNGYYTLFGYDTAGRLTSLRHYDASNTVVAGYLYTINARGNITQENSTLPFDPTPTNLFNGTTSYHYNTTNQLVSINGEAVTVDVDGRTTHKPDTDYVFDTDDRLIEVNGLDFTAQYAYDALGFRRTATRNGEAIQYEWDTRGMGNILVEKQGAEEHYYFYGPTGLIARIGEDNTLHFYHGDIRGSVILMTDADGEITHEYGYDDFGTITHIAEQDENRFRYVGLNGVQYEHEDLQFMRARYYDPGIGRFLSEDPVWSQNLYPYAGNNPIGNIDPTGLYLEPSEFITNGATDYLTNYSKQNNHSEPEPLWCPVDKTPVMTELHPTPQEGWKIFYRKNEKQIKEFGSLLIDFTLILATDGASSSYSSATRGLQFTKHGSQRIAGINATREGVLSIDEIITTQSLGRVLTQADGARVYLHQIGSGKFNVVVEGSLGIITTHRHFTSSAIFRLINRYGWK